MREHDALDDAVARADLFRSRQAAFGAGASTPKRCGSPPASSRRWPTARAAPSSASRSPNPPRSVCDEVGRIVRSNPAFHRLAGAAGDADLLRNAPFADSFRP